MALNHVTLDDKYDLTKSRIFVTGYQALIRLCLMQKERDRRAGLNTAGFVTGYRGSPLGGLDQQFMRAREQLVPNDIRFQPGLNEDLAATAIWGSQQAELRGEGKYDGVFAMWYGKGPGVDRTGDVFRHANFAGTSKHGGVLALMGDDHTAESSTTAHQSEFHFVDVMIPILNPAGVQEIPRLRALRLGDVALTAAAGSRSSACTRRSSSTAVDRRQPRPREDRHSRSFDLAAAGSSACRRAASTSGSATACSAWRRGCTTTSATPCWPSCAPTSSTATSPRAAAIRRSASSRSARAISTCARRFDELGIDEVRCNDFGIRLYKVACPWPLEPARAQGVRRRARPHHRGRGEALAHRGAGARGALRHRQPAGLHRQEGRAGQLAVPGQGRARSQRHRDLHRRAHPPARPQRADRGRGRAAQGGAARARRDAEVAQRMPYFCSGCPHNSSTVVPEGMRAYAGIGCHYMVQWMDRSTSASPRWAGRAPTGSARRRSPRARTCSRTSATAPTTIPATWRSAPRSRRASTSPTRSCSTTRSP